MHTGFSAPTEHRASVTDGQNEIWDVSSVVSAAEVDGVRLTSHLLLFLSDLSMMMALIQ